MRRACEGMEVKMASLTPATAEIVAPLCAQVSEETGFVCDIAAINTDKTVLRFAIINS